jgi:serine/threonine protein kinase/predicted negative regulator of RcsB-dependent stress response
MDPPDNGLLDERVAEALDRIAQRIQSGQDITSHELQSEYPDLMPQLAAQVADLRTLIKTEHALKARTPSGFDESEEPGVADALKGALPAYQILEVVHRGGQGVVLRAIQKSTNREVAIKVILDGPLANPQRVRRFAREIRIASQLQLPNIVPVFDSGVVEGRQYFVMQFVDGIPIDDYALLQQLSVPERAALVARVVRAVSRAHQRGIIHRDLKPFNILVDSDGEPQILDFGLAKALSAATDSTDAEPVSLVGHVVGTLPYVSPEQANGFDAVDVRSDVYALGVLLFELLTGEYPYRIGKNSAEARLQILNAKPQSLKEAAPVGEWTGFPSAVDLDEDLQSIVTKALEKERSDRYQSASEFTDDLDRYLTGGIVQARLDQHWYIVRRLIRRYRTHLTVAALFLILLTGSAMLTTKMWIQARRQRDTARDMANLAQSTLNDVVTNVNDEIEALAGGRIIRAKLLTGVAQRLDDLTTHAPADTFADMVYVSLSEKQGDIARSDGRDQEARNYYSNAVALLKANAEKPIDVSMARLYRKLSHTTTDGEQYLESALAYARKASNATQEHARTELARVLIDYARTDYLSGLYSSASKHLNESLTILEQLNESALRAEALEWDGDIHVKLGNTERSIQSFQESLGIRAEQLSDRPFDVRIRYDFMISSTKLSAILALSGQFEEAIARGREAVGVGEYLLNIDPNNPDYRRDCVSTQSHLASVLRQSGDPSEALVLATSAIDTNRTLMDSGKSTVELQRQLGYALHERALIHRMTKSFADELDDAQACLSVRQELARLHRENLDFLSELAAAHESVSLALQHTSEAAQAYDHLVAANSIHGELLQKQPEVAERLLNLSSSEINLAAWHINRRTRLDDSKAQILLDAAELRLATLSKTQPNIQHVPRFVRFQSAIQRIQSILKRRALQANQSVSKGHSALQLARLHHRQSVLAQLPV